MFRNLAERSRRFDSRSNRRSNKPRQSSRSRRLALESLELRQMLSVTPANIIDSSLVEHQVNNLPHGPVGYEARIEIQWINGKSYQLITEPMITEQLDSDGFGILSNGALHPLSSLPQLHSNLGAAATLYLDFDGHFEAQWGSYSNITTPVYDIDGDLTTFSDLELQNIYSAWQTVAEDYAPFNIDVTTVEPPELAPGVPESAANGVALRVAIGDGSWISGGGLAYVGSFANSGPNTVYVIPPGLSVDKIRIQKFIGDTASHEAGHAFGLSHQSSYDQNGVKIEEYNTGDGIWAPLMGYPYTAGVKTWHNGPNSGGPTSYQDDMAVIAGSANGFGYRADDVGNYIGNASNLAFDGSVYGGSGIIGTNSDVDAWSFTVSTEDTYRLTVNPADINPNLDAVLELRNAAGSLIASASPAVSQAAELVLQLFPGVYFASVTKTAAYGWLGAYTLSVAAPPAGVTTSPTDMLLVPERGEASFTVMLDTRPSANVVVPLSLSDAGQATLSSTSLTFTSANWNMPQTVTVTGIDDGAIDGDVSFNVVLGIVSSTDSEYSGFNPADVAAISSDHAYGGFAYWTDRTSDLIQRSPLNGGPVQSLVDLKTLYGGVSEQYSPRALAVDAAGGKMYWTDQKSGRIQRANLDGSSVETILAGFADGGLLGIEIDAKAGKIYWVDGAAQKIQRANLDGSTVEDLVTSQAGLWDLAVDAAGGKMYWGSIGDGSIYRANLDGSVVELLWTGDELSNPRALALDLSAGKLYWADSGNQQILRANLDGTSAEVVADQSSLVQSPLWWLTVDSREGKIYWTDLDRDAVFRMNLDGSGTTKIVSRLIDPQGVAVVEPAVSVTPRVGLTTTESGGPAAFQVTLTTPPKSDVTIPISSSDSQEGTPTQSSVTFTPANWNVPQTVTVVGVDDHLVDGNQSYSVLLGPAVSTDPDYAGINPADVSLTNVENSTKFFIVDDAATDRNYQYLPNGNFDGSTTLASGNSTPRGVTSSAGSNKTWVINSDRVVYVYDTAGAPLGSWTAGTMANNATPQGIATDGTDIWIVDSRSDKVYRYANAASRLTGSQSAAGNFSLNSGNLNSTGLVTDGTSLWVTNNNSTDKVFKYSLAGALLGSWTIDSANSNPVGAAIDPANPNNLLITDSGTDRVYQYTGAVTRTSGSQSASLSFALASGNANPQGIVAVTVSNGSVNSADLTVNSTAVSSTTEGNLVTFNLSVTNNGPASATGVVLTDTLGANWVYNSASTSQGTIQQSGGVVTSTIGTVLPGQTVTVQVRATALEAGNLTNTASVAGSSSDYDLGNNSALNIVSVAASPIIVSGSPLTVSGKKLSNIATAAFTHANGVHPASYYTTTIAWGDGTTSTGSISQSGTTYTVKGSHTYSSNGSYSVTTTVVRANTSSSATIDAALPMDSADRLSSRATLSGASTSRLIKFAALPENRVGGDPSPAKKFDNFLAREQVFASFSQKGNDGPAKHTLRAGRDNEHDDVIFANSVADDNAALYFALDAALASLI